MIPSPLYRFGAVAALTLGTLSLVITNILQWTLQPSGGDVGPTSVAAQFPGQWLLVGMLSVFGSLVWLAGLPPTVALASGRGSVVAGLGGALTGVGLAAGIGHLALFFGLGSTLVASGLAAGDLQAVSRAADADVLSTCLLVVFLVGFALGPIVLTVGLRMAHLVGVWVPIAAVVAAVANFVPSPIAGVAQLVAIVAVWGAVSVALVRSRVTLPEGSRMPIPA